MEEWRTIADTNGMYEVSDTGQVRSWQRARRHWNDPVPRMLEGTDSKGYRMVHVMGYGKTGWAMVHRLVAQAFLDPPMDEQIEVHHRNHERGDNRAANLEWVAVKSNRHNRRPPRRPRYQELYTLIATLGWMANQHG